MFRDFEYRNAQRAGASAARIAAFSGAAFGRRAFGFPMVLFNADGGEGGGGAGAGGDDAAKAAAEAAAKAAADAAAAGKGKEGGDAAATAAAKELSDAKAAADAAKKEAADAKAALAAYEGVDAKTAKELAKAKADADKAALEAKGDWEKLKATMAAEHTKDLDAAKAESATKDKTIADLQAKVADLTVGSAFQASEFVGKELVNGPQAVRAMFGGHFALDGDKVVAFDKAAGADRVKLVDAKGEPLAFDVALARLVESHGERDKLRKAKGANGAGSRTDAVKVGADGKPLPLSPREIVAAALKAGRK